MKRIIFLDPDVKHVSSESVEAMCKLTELFMGCNLCLLT
jgi:hypothetical protein